jgi:hypothetical protein
MSEANDTTSAKSRTRSERRATKNINNKKEIRTYYLYFAVLTHVPFVTFAVLT